MVLFTRAALPACFRAAFARFPIFGVVFCLNVLFCLGTVLPVCFLSYNCSRRRAPGRGTRRTAEGPTEGPPSPP
jgi:hypothetical protein